MPAAKRTAATSNPVEAEATDALVSFDFDGESYLALSTDEWTWDALESYEEGKVTAFVGAILEPASFARYKATKPKAKDVGRFVEAIQGALGISGN